MVLNHHQLVLVNLHTLSTKRERVAHLQLPSMHVDANILRNVTLDVLQCLNLCHRILNVDFDLYG